MFYIFNTTNLRMHCGSKVEKIDITCSKFVRTSEIKLPKNKTQHFGGHYFFSGHRKIKSSTTFVNNRLSFQKSLKFLYLEQLPGTSLLLKSAKNAIFSFFLKFVVMFS